MAGLSEDSVQVSMLCFAAEASLKRGAWAESKKHAEEALALARVSGMRDSEAHALYCLGAALGQLGQKDEGLEEQRSSLAIYQELGDANGISRSLENISIMVSDPAESLICAQKSASAARHAGLREREAVALVRAGTLLSRGGQAQDASACFEQAQAVILKIEDSHMRDYRMNYCLGQFGRSLCGLMGSKPTCIDRTMGLQLLNEAILCAQRIGSSHAEEYNRAYKALALEQGGRVQEAIDELLLIEASFFNRWKAVSADNLRRTFRDTWLPTTVSCGLQRLHLETGNPECALLAAERNRAWAFSALLAEQHGEAISQMCFRWEDVATLAQHESAAILYFSMLQVGCVGIWVIGSDGRLLGHCQVELGEVFTNMEGICSLSDLVQIVRGGVLAHEFVQDDPVLAPTEAAPNFGQLNNVPARGPLRQRVKGADTQLERCYDCFLRPVQHLLSKESHLIIVPDGELYLLPFAALKDSRTGRYLIELCTVRYAPSLAALLALRKRQAMLSEEPARSAPDHPTEVLIVAVEHFQSHVEGEPLQSLPAAVVEADAIKTMCEARGMSVDTRLNGSATKSAVIARLPAARRLIHFCTHGILEKSALVFHSEGGDESEFLTANELQHMQLSASLGVISACNTGRGVISADGVVGLCRSFLAAGLDAVLVSLWKVGDESTCEFMRLFYSWYLDSGEVHLAMKEAMCHMLRRRTESGFRVFFPMDWAPFVCVGTLPGSVRV